MIELFTAATGNGHRAAIAVVESGVPYTVRRLDLARKEQQEPWYLALNPRGQIPTIVDHDGPGGAPITVTQSGAIMLYLAEKTGHFLPDDAMRSIVLQMFFHVCTDIAGFNASLTLVEREISQPSEPVQDYLWHLLMRYFKVLDRQLATAAFLAGDLSIADLALYPTVIRRFERIKNAGLVNLLGWQERLGKRPGVRRGMALSQQP